MGWAFAAPFVILFGAFLALPILASFLLSFTSFGLRDLANPAGASAVGLKNYIDLFSDAKFWKALFNTFYFVVVGVPVTLAFGLLIANALNRGVNRFRTAFRVGYYLPVITSIVAIAVVWRFLLNPDVGLINMLLGGLGIAGPIVAGGPGPRDALDHRHGGLAEPRVRHDRVPRRHAGDPGACSTRPPASTAPDAGSHSAT